MLILLKEMNAAGTHSASEFYQSTSKDILKF